jgi:hypothetical protein
MNSGWAWFLVWSLLGSAAALGAVSLGPLLVLPVLLGGVFLWTKRPDARDSAFGLVSGAGTLLLYIAWLQRDGPGTTCTRTATSVRCDAHLNPLPWLVLGIVLLVTGVVAQARYWRRSAR